MISQDRIKAVAFDKTDGRTEAIIKDFPTVENAKKWLKRQSGQKFIAVGTKEIQLMMQILGAEVQ